MKTSGRQPKETAFQSTPDPRQSLELENPLWQFAIEQWQSKKTQTACLALQDAGWVVSHLIVALWQARKGQRWDALEPVAVTHWRQTYTAPLRQMRQSLAKQEAIAGLRRQVAEAELEAERIELALWHRHFDEPTTAHNADDGADQSKKTDGEPHHTGQHPTRLAALNLLTLAHARHAGGNTSLLQALMLATHPSLRQDRVASLLDACRAELEELAP